MSFPPTASAAWLVVCSCSGVTPSRFWQHFVPYVDFVDLNKDDDINIDEDEIESVLYNALEEIFLEKQYHEKCLLILVHAIRQTGGPSLNKTQAQTEHIITAFRNFKENVSYVTVQPFTAVSPYSTMHEDICKSAEEKRVTTIIVPFHKQQTVDGDMLETNLALRMLNHDLLQSAPCSVAILVDRGLNGSNQLASDKSTHQVAVLIHSTEQVCQMT